MQLCFFSDRKSKNFLPLTLTRPVFDLRLGILTIQEKWEKYLNTQFTAGIYEEYLSSVFKSHQIDKEQICIWVNSRYLPTNDLVNTIKSLANGECLVQNDEIIAANIDGNRSISMYNNKDFGVDELTKVEYSLETKSITFFWDLLSLNGEGISSDLQFFNYNPIGDSRLNKDSIFRNAENIFISDSAKIEPGCIFIADNGPIFIGDNSTIEAGSIVKGPVAICKGATIKMRARIYDSTTIGPFSKVGGEVSNSIFHSYSNKAHDGFVGNSLIGQWCNFGADTNTSNLKNNYAEVKIFDWTSKVEYEKGFQFFGTIFGDHSKTAINTVLNTGTTCGVSSNIFSLGFPPKYIPSFLWMGQEKTLPHDFEKAISAMRAMMKRRDVELSDNYIEMMKYIAESS